MKLKNPNLPYLLLLVLPFPHLWLGVKELAKDPTQAAGMAIGFPVLLFSDWLYGLILLWLLLSQTLRWRTRERGLMVLGALTVVAWLLPLTTESPTLTALKKLDMGSLSLFFFLSGPLIAFTTGVLMLRRHPYLREQ